MELILCSDDSCVYCSDSTCHCNKIVIDGDHECSMYIEREEKEPVYEICPHCNNEISMMWDVKSDGYQAFCPICGERLMLCSECPATMDKMTCDYDKDTDKCSMQKNPKEGEK